jgi:transcriptional regulator with XRE-family HTH domain
MAKTAPPILPALRRHLQELGENIRLARLRRGFAAELIAERVGISRPTLRAIERGDGSVSMGAYASVLQTLGLEKTLAGVARDDVLGRKLQDLNVKVRKRAPRVRRTP